MATKLATIDLRFAESANQIRQSLGNFAAEMTRYPELARSLIAQTTFWVYEPKSRAFGPSKFVGFRDMDFSRYETARSGGAAGARFDGHATRDRIGNVLAAEYAPNESRGRELRAWAGAAFPDPPSVLAGVDTSKWVFVSLPGTNEVVEWSAEELKHTLDSYMEMLHAELVGVHRSEDDQRPKVDAVPGDGE